MAMAINNTTWMGDSIFDLDIAIPPSSPLAPIQLDRASTLSMTMAKAICELCRSSAREHLSQTYQQHGWLEVLVLYWRESYQTTGEIDFPIPYSFYLGSIFI
ncbi:hypothetical protein ACH5RR_032186 [Cinchona calisaya]|uniref:Uncharacterized protein n=1 Tax=Cinchona calisaya TaxID=153742 RepID=A0ABD2YHC9_9GENT